MTPKQALLGISRIPRIVLTGVISLYQKTLSPDHGPLKFLFPHGYCPYVPTCSEYGKQAIHKHGVLYGSLLTLWRILRCNPWTKGGIDEVPHKHI
ncbi:MAG: membrane protein insertion efficiency factor YidD [Patescibacteria group bacterium]